jgi:hypothetical protein
VKTVVPGTVPPSTAPSEMISVPLNSGLAASALIEVGTDHRLADPGPLERMLRVCEDCP